MTARTITLIISDTHFGSTLALAPLKFPIHIERPKETQQVEANTGQRWLNECWSDLGQYVKELAGIRGKSRKARLVVCHLGDVVDGLHHGSTQVANEIADQTNMACEMLRPWAALADKMFITYGTGAHNGGQGEYEGAIARELGVQHDWEFCLDIDGVTVDIGHHSRAGQRDWTSAAAGVVAEVQLDYLKRGLQPPMYVFRGHNHIIDDSGVKNELTRYVCCPSWQLRTAFGYRVATNKKRSDIGALIIDGGVLSFAKARYKAPAGFINTVKV